MISVEEGICYKLNQQECQSFRDYISKEYNELWEN